MVDAASYGVRVIYSAQGGVDIEQSGAAQGRLCAPHPGAVAEALAELIAGEPEPWRGQSPRSAASWRTLLIERELALAEINPLFVSAAGCVAGDAKVVVDLERGRASAAHRRADRGAAGDLRRRQPQAARRLRLCRTRSGGRDRPGHHRRRPVDDADRRTHRARQQAAEFLRHPHRPDARQSGAADARAGMDHGAAVVARGAGEHLRRHHRSGRVRRPAGDGGSSRPRACACRSWRGWSAAAPPRRSASWRNASPTCWSPRIWKRRWEGRRAMASAHSPAPARGGEVSRLSPSPRGRELGGDRLAVARPRPSSCRASPAAWAARTRR